jgi:uncharacterized protein YukE
MVLQFLREQVENVMSGVSQQKEITTNVMETIKGYVPMVQQSWIGGDADEFAADVMRKVIPAILELIAAIAGVNLNLSKATSIVDQADAKVKSLASGISDIFGSIC